MKIYKQLRVCVKGFQKILEKNKFKKTNKKEITISSQIHHL